MVKDWYTQFVTKAIHKMGKRPKKEKKRSNLLIIFLICKFLSSQVSIPLVKKCYQLR